MPSRVEIFVQPCLSAILDIFVEIWKDTSTTNPVVATGTISGSNISATSRGSGCRDESAYWVSVDMRGAQFTVTAGQTYSVWPSTTLEAYAWLGADRYAGGSFIPPNSMSPTGYVVSPTNDVGFQTFVLVP